MAISLYDATVTGFLQILSAAEGVLEKGRAHCEANGIDLNDVVETRLIENMFPFRFQVNSVAHHTAGAIAGVKKGVFSPDPGSLTADYAELQKVLAAARAEVAACTPDEINAFEGRDVLFQFGEMKMPFTAEGFLLSFSLPNLHFHATTAYDILRTKGVPLGKRDFMGQLRMTA